jgi:hypothetical protein
MKKRVWTVLLMAVVSARLSAQTYEVQQLLLNVEKLAQLKQMLTDLKRGYEIIHRGYTSIRTISQENFNLHHLFLDGLLRVNPAVRNYIKVGELLDDGTALLKEQQTSLRYFRLSGQFTNAELGYVAKVFRSLTDGSFRTLDALLLVLTVGGLRMSDDERLRLIDSLQAETRERLVFLRHFTSNASKLGLQRAKEALDMAVRKKIQGIH